MFRTKRLVLLLGLFTLIMTGCKDTSKNESVADDTSSSKTESDTDNTSSSKTEKKTGAYATIKFDDGRTIEMEARSQKGFLGLPNKFEGNMTDYKVIVMIELRDSEPLQNKTYEKGAFLSISNMQGDIPLEESFGSNNKNEDGKQGDAKIKITSISKTHAEGTFTGTLYSKSHRKATIEGKFVTKSKE